MNQNNDENPSWDKILFCCVIFVFWLLILVVLKCTSQKTATKIGMWEENECYSDVSENPSLSYQ